VNLPPFLESFAIALGINAVLAYPVYRLLLAMRSRQTIDPHAPEGHQKKQGTPTMGGLMILVGLMAALVWTQPHLGTILLVVGFGAIGFVDDYVVPRMMPGKRGLGWKQKLAMQVLLSVAVVMVGPGAPRDAWWIAFGALTIIFFSNAYNFADGLDWLAGTLLIAYCLGAFFLTSIFPSTLANEQAIVSSMLGAILPFMYLNAPPAKVFMGDVGSLPIGALIGYLNFTVLYGNRNGSTPNGALFGLLFILGLVLVLELVLVPIQVFYYKRTKKRIFPATPIHHAFEVKGMPERRIVALFFAVQIFLSVAVVAMATSSQTVVVQNMTSGGLDGP
jgi:phospho-N-acetylmuramoyl-pentapeptide-transferase